jgi:4-amino-4-deoxy-L-arabinose transferase-like glycosyltransferase
MAKTTKSQLVTAQIITWVGAIIAAAVVFYLPHGPAPKHVFILFPVLAILGGVSVWTLLQADFGEPAESDESPTDNG